MPPFLPPIGSYMPAHFYFEWADPEGGLMGQLPWTWLPRRFQNSPILFYGALSADLLTLWLMYPESTSFQQHPYKLQKQRTSMRRYWVWGVPANTTATRVLIQVRQEGSPVQHNSVAGVGSNFESLTLSSLFQAHLSTIQFGRKFLGND